MGATSNYQSLYRLDVFHILVATYQLTCESDSFIIFIHEDVAYTAVQLAIINDLICRYIVLFQCDQVYVFVIHFEKSTAFLSLLKSFKILLLFTEFHCFVSDDFRLSYHVLV